MNLAQLRRAESRLLVPTYRRAPVYFRRGRGCYLFDDQGKRYLDFITGIGVNALGYAHPGILAVLQFQSARLIHLSNLYPNEFQVSAARQLCAMSGLERVFFTNSGTEAIEGALKLARLYARKTHRSARAGPPGHFLAVEHSFHGRTFGALSITFPGKYRKPYAPLLAGARFVRFNDLDDLRRKFDSRVAAIILEPIQGEAGVRPISAEFYREARRLAAKRGALLVADEIQCGLSRTGRHFAFERLGGRPDVITVAKPLAGGLPLGAFLASERVANVFSPGIHGTTFGGGPLACAVATEVLNIVRRRKMLEHIRRMGELVLSGLDELRRKFSYVKEVRGAGLMLGMELDCAGEKIVDRARDFGLLINCAHERTLRFLPPYIVEPAHVDEFLNKLERALVR